LEIGSKIKYSRTQKQLTQESLAEGIISVSYLSKIENNQVSASMEIIHLLCERLGISIDSKVDTLVITLCENWFKSLLKRDKENAQDYYAGIVGDLDSIEHHNLFKLVEIHKIKHYLLTQDVAQAFRQIQQLKRQKYHFTKVEEYYWYKFIAYFEYANSNYDKSYSLYTKALNLWSFDVYSYEEEQSDLFYSLGVVCSKLWNTYQSINYVSKSLDYYQRHYDLKRCAECHILLGISNRRHKEYNKAIESYKNAKNLAEMLNNQSLLSLCEQNIGHLYSVQKMPSEAIRHFEKCYNIRIDRDAMGSLTPIYSLVKEYHQFGNTVKSKEWLTVGEGIIKDLQLGLSVPIVIDFRIFHFLLNDYGENFETFMKETVLPYYEEKENKVELSKNMKLLAQYYYDDRKYKNAYNLLKKSTNM
jgi:HTH-type transcriptional regulator, quorum sensing regulator NprR